MPELSLWIKLLNICFFCSPFCSPYKSVHEAQKTASIRTFVQCNHRRILKSAELCSKKSIKSAIHNKVCTYSGFIMRLQEERGARRSPTLCGGVLRATRPPTSCWRVSFKPIMISCKHVSLTKRPMVIMISHDICHAPTRRRRARLCSPGWRFTGVNRIE
jgi:hypothetical protein